MGILHCISTILMDEFMWTASGTMRKKNGECIFLVEDVMFH